jgi:hypothetical protein
VVTNAEPPPVRIGQLETSPPELSPEDSVLLDQIGDQPKQQRQYLKL